ncbi:gluconate 2-dehydrogenase [Alteribacillus persepolensis]|uniref:Gluconate 2-dehydrogenase n=1 Tax=Alteribacillus persepolensis TaxID=568899 RepID=A0A1G8IUH3_9BACI|nr:D-glycerate dehydrogenase [Alteribacillus persepolensis]SDI22462.1 gluconate 2-dehydrogenase [Alteribacillus persepolensis]
MKPNVVVYNRIAEEQVKRIEEHCHVYQISKESKEFMNYLSKAEGIIGAGLKVDKKLLDHAPNLRIVSNVSAGYDNLDIEELTKRRIMAANTPDVLTETTADTIFGLLIAAARRMPELDSYVKSGKWQTKIMEDQFGVDVHHKTLGIIGMGRIGKAVAERAHYGFKMNILYHNRSRNEAAEKELHARYTDEDELLKHSDFVCLLAPLTPETVGLIGKREFHLMKKESIFINGGRGDLVIEEDLVQALKEKQIRAAGLDVYKQEPLGDNHPLLHMKNVVTLPHIGSATKETREKMAEAAVENLLQGIGGKVPPCLINREVL